MVDLRSTLQLHESPVPMRAGLPALEPKILAEWQSEDLYRQLREKRAGAPRFLLHDGPPYANGDLHMGHALNKVLKDIIVRYKSMTGFDAPYVPGWDCHGLPIEHNVLKEFTSSDKSAIRRKCREFAAKYVEIQREGFIRLGCMGEWEKPYLTMDPKFEARILEAFGTLHEKGFIYRGQKPIHWCPTCRTALAASTAESEYQTHTTDAITVAFPSVDDPSLSILIWTTTPWTLPANLALAVHPDMTYGIVDGRISAKADGELRGRDLVGKSFRHPFLDRTSTVYAADFVTGGEGTGVVHIAPGHGEDDYRLGREHGIDAFAPVDASGRFTKDAGVFEGESVFDANPKIIELLRERGALIKAEKIEHQYPHCWRCKGPIIFRATRQWFMSVDKDDLRRKALEAAELIQWIPAWGKDRFVGTVKERPDWCLSRQRSWGVPIPAYVCQSCDEAVVDAAEAIRLAREGRLDDWFDGASRSCPKCRGTMTRENDILDVWFDSGVSWFATDMIRGGARETDDLLIADLYLEGSDQHRGWFQSSLWPSLAIRGVAPYFAVLTHGFMLDGKGHAMHKSAGNAIAPSEILQKYGADIIRLWVASENYRDDLPLSHDILAQVAETYRKIRNTWRFLSANILDLPEGFSMTVAEREELDAWAVAALDRYITRVRAAYDTYLFHDVYRATLEFFTTDLSSFYLDILKDRLYCDGKESPSRRAAQVTCREILVATLKATAPILCFTTDEIWRLMKFGNSVHLADWPVLNGAQAPDFDSILSARSEILKAIEEQRAAGAIKSSQMAAVTTTFGGDLETLRRLCQVAEIERAEKVTARATSKTKCPRCWRYIDFAGDLCGRCAEVIA